VDNNPTLDEARRQAAALQQQLDELRARGGDPAAEAKLEHELLQVYKVLGNQQAAAPAPAYGQTPYVPSPYAPQSYGQQPHMPYQESRATMILVFGILSIVVCQLFGPFAWSMGTDELRKMDQGLVDPRERGSVSAGRICGMIGTGLMVVSVLAVLSMFAFAASFSRY
jgi:hypothetical protein